VSEDVFDRIASGESQLETDNHGRVSVVRSTPKAKPTTRKRKAKPKPLPLSPALEALFSQIEEHEGRPVGQDEWEVIDGFLQNECTDAGLFLYCYALQLHWEHHAGEDGFLMPVEPLVALVEAITGEDIRWPEGITVEPYWLVEVV